MAEELEIYASLVVAPMPHCARCGVPLVTEAGFVKLGRPQMWCSDACRKRAERQVARGHLADCPEAIAGRYVDPCPYCTWRRAGSPARGVPPQL